MFSGNKRWKWRGDNGGGRNDPTVNSGLLGMCLRSYEATGNKFDLRLRADVDGCFTAADASTRYRDVTFHCGRGGVYAIGAASANFCGTKEV